MKSNNYILKFNNGKEDVFDLSFDKSHKFEKEPKVTLSLVSISIDKEMYKPSCVRVCVRVIKNENGELTDDDVRKLTDYLNKLRADIYMSDAQKDSNKVAHRYLVMNLTPRRTFKDGKMSLEIEIDLNSPDKCFDTMKYSRCYTAQRLGSDILKNVLGDLNSQQGVKIDSDYSHQQNMQAALGADIEPGLESYSNGATRYLEAIMPYVVQYNETPHSMISRTANRCGEFFFYENGKLYLGLDTTNSDAAKKTSGLNYKFKVNELEVTRPNGSKTIQLKPGEIANIEYNVFGSTDEAVTQYANYTDKSSPYAASNTTVQSYEGPASEYVEGYAELPVQKDYWEMFKLDMTTAYWWFPMMMYMLKRDSVADMMSFMLASQGLEAVSRKSRQAARQEAYHTDFVMPFKEGDPTKAKAPHVGLGKIFPFCAANKFGMNQMKDFYQNVKERAAVSKRRAVKVTLAKGAQTIIRLGDFVNLYGREYVVTKVHQSANNSSDGLSLTKDELSRLSMDQIVAKVLASAKQSESDNDNDWFEGVPAMMVYTGTSGGIKTYGVRFAPMPLEGNLRRTSAPQRAFISANTDPAELGRVRILYPWQSKDANNASPYIRMTETMASSRGGIRFRPQVGDEVMIGYEYDDIERPFVIGAVSSAATNGGSDVRGNDDVIRSPNGQKIIFRNPASGSYFTKSFLPATVPLTTLGVRVGLFSEKGSTTDSALGGSMQFTDEYGVYSVVLSTEKRAVSIKSNLGTVSIDALTGITINCPTGDVFIKGKNVSIEAMNELNLVSGKNIKKQSAYKALSGKNRIDGEDDKGGIGSQIGSAALASGMDIATHSKLGGVTSAQDDVIEFNRNSLADCINPIDIYTLRVITDSLLKPVNGTLSIKSNRFLKLEAGKGEVKMPNMYRKKDEGSANVTKDSSNYKQQKELEDAQNKAGHLIMYMLENYESHYESVLVKNDLRRKQLENILHDISVGHIEVNADLAIFQYAGGRTYTGRELVDVIEKEYIGKITSKTDIDTDAELSTDKVIEKIKINAEEEIPLTEADKCQLKYCIHRWAKYQKDLKKRAEDNVADRFANAGEISVDDALKLLNIIHKCRDEVAAEESSTVRKRMFMYKAIDMLKTEGFIKLRKDFPLMGILTKEKKTVAHDISVCKDTVRWKRYLNCLTIDTRHWTKVCGRAFADFMEWSPVLDTFANSVDLWYPAEEGQVLIADSNTKGSTLSLDGKNNMFKSTPPDEFSSAIRTLKDI